VPQKIINGDFESPTQLAFWTIQSGSPVIKTDHPFAGNQYAYFLSGQNGSIKQSFPSPVNAAQFSTWVAPTSQSGSSGNSTMFDSAAGTGSVENIQGGTQAGLGTISWNHTIGTGSNEILLVCLYSASGSPSATYTPFIRSVIFGSTALARFASSFGVGGSAEAWYLLSPSTGSATITVTYANLYSLGNWPIVGASVSYSNVKQIVPTAVIATGNNSSPSVSVTANAESVLFVGAVSNNSITISSGSQTQRIGESGSITSPWYNVINISDLNYGNTMLTGTITGGGTVGWTAMGISLPLSLSSGSTIPPAFNYKLYFADGTSETDTAQPAVSTTNSNIMFVGQSLNNGLVAAGTNVFTLNTLNNVLTSDFIFVGIEVLGNNTLLSLTDDHSNSYTIFSVNYNSANNNTLIMAGCYASLPSTITVHGQWSNVTTSKYFGAVVANYRGANGALPTNIQINTGNTVNITTVSSSKLIGIGDNYSTGNNQNNRAVFDDNIPTFVNSIEFSVSGTDYFGASSQTMNTIISTGPYQNIMVWVNVLMQNQIDVPTVTVTDSNSTLYSYNAVYISGPLGLNRIFLFAASTGNTSSVNPSFTISVSGGTVQNWDAVIQILGSSASSSNNAVQNTNITAFVSTSPSSANPSLPQLMNYSGMIAGYFYASGNYPLFPNVIGTGNTTIEPDYTPNSTYNFVHGSTHTTSVLNDGSGTSSIAIGNLPASFLIFVIIEVDATNSAGNVNPPPVASLQDKNAAANTLYNFSVPGLTGHVSVLELDVGITPLWYKYQRYFSPPKYITAVELNVPSTNSSPVGFDEVQLWEDSLGVEESDLPKYQALVFRQAHPESEDNFMRGFINYGVGVISTDGDILTEYITGSTSWVDYGTFFRTPIDVVNTYKTLVVRVRGTAPNYSVFLHDTNGNNSLTPAFNASTPQNWTILTYDLSGASSPLAGSFYLRAGSFEFNTTNKNGQNVQWDFALFCTGSYLDISQDIINLDIKRSTQNIGSFTADINNLNGKYVSGSNAFHYWDDIIIYGGYQTYTGSSAINYEKIFGGKIEELTPKLNATDGEILSISGQDYGDGLKNILAFAEYSSTGSLIGNNVVWPTAGNIMNDVVNRFVNQTQVSYFTLGGVGHIIYNTPTGYRLPTDMTGSGIFNSSNTIGGYASWQTGSLLYYYQVRQAPVWQALSDLGDMYYATQTTGSGIEIGDTPIQTIDYYISPARALHFEELAQARIRGRHFGKTLTSVADSPANNIIDFNLQTDVNDMVNKVDYFSSFWLPSTGDAWTEGDAGSWIISNGISDYPAGWTAINNTFSAVGSFAVEATGSSGLNTVFLAFNIPNGPINFFQFGSPISIPLLYFYHWADSGGNGYFLDIRAETNANTDYYSLRSNGLLTGSAGVTEFVWPGIYSAFGAWHFAGIAGAGIGAIPIGPYAPTGSGTTAGLSNWIQTGNPNWGNINRISIGFTADGGTISSGSVDGLHIESLRYDIATNSTSINKYALREEFVTDPLIKDSGSSPLFAKAEILRFSRPIIRGTIQSRFYPTAHPAQLAIVNYPDAGYYNQDFRITDIEHNISATEGITTTFSLNSDTGSTHPIHRSDMISSILQSSAIGSQSVTELLNVQFDPFLTPNIIDYPLAGT
jgi:hypothetical protein